MLLDLHLHTSASDGQYTPSETVAMAKAKKLNLIAITDHDTVNGIVEAKEKATELGLNFISGIEISTQKKEEIHILGYEIDESNTELLEYCRVWEEGRLGRGGRICAFFEKRNIPINFEEVKTIAGTGSMGRPHFAQWLQEHGYVKERKDAFKKFLDTPEFHIETDRIKPSPDEAIELIHAAGGKAVLAHPGLLKMTLQEQKILIKELKAHGLDGIECFYSKHDTGQAATYLSLAERNCLKISCGSDFHGELVKPIEMGMRLGQEHIEKLVIDIDAIN